MSYRRACLTLMGETSSSWFLSKQLLTESLCSFAGAFHGSQVPLQKSWRADAPGLLATLLLLSFSLIWIFFFPEGIMSLTVALWFTYSPTSDWLTGKMKICIMQDARLSILGTMSEIRFTSDARTAFSFSIFPYCVGMWPVLSFWILFPLVPKNLPD